MSELQHTATHEADGVARLLERFKGQPNMEGALRVVLRRVQAYEDVLYAVYAGVWLDNAVGAQLDNLGWVVGEPRKGRGDDQYRLYIRARIAINRANGQASDTLKVARLVLESTAGLAFASEYPAAYRVDVTNTAIAASDLRAVLDEVRPAGVGLTVRVVYDTATAFIFNTAAPATNGFNNGLLADGV